MKKPTIVMQSDFGIDSGLVACMHGMCRLVDSELETQDITHLIPAFDIEAALLFAIYGSVLARWYGFLYR